MAVNPTAIAKARQYTRRDRSPRPRDVLVIKRRLAAVEDRVADATAGPLPVEKARVKVGVEGGQAFHLLAQGPQPLVMGFDGLALDVEYALGVHHLQHKRPAKGFERNILHRPNLGRLNFALELAIGLASHAGGGEMRGRRGDKVATLVTQTASRHWRG